MLLFPLSILPVLGKRKLTLKLSDLDYYRGERGRRGAKLPRGLKRVDRIEIEPAGGAEPVVGENQEGRVINKMGAKAPFSTLKI